MKAVKFLQGVFRKMLVNHRCRDVVKPHLRDVYEGNDGVNIAVKSILLKADVFPNHHIGDFQG